MWPFVIVVFDEFPVELESCMLLVVGSEPSFNLALRGGFTDVSKDMFDAYSWAAWSSSQIAFPAVPSLKIWLAVT